MSFLLWLAALPCRAARIRATGSTKFQSCATLALGCLGAGVSVAAATNPLTLNHAKDGLVQFRREMPRTVRADHPAILPVVAAIRAITLNPLEQIVVVNDVTHLLVDYDDDERVYGRTEYQATLDEMLERRREAGWIYLRDDCDGRAVLAAHLLASLGIPWRLEASYWQQHAWIVATVGGVRYDLLQLRDATTGNPNLGYRLLGRHFVRAPHSPPYFQWRRAWRERTSADLEVGKRLGMLEADATAAHLRERYSSDWTKLQPAGSLSPFDPRTLSATHAGFPLGASLRPVAVAAALNPSSPAAAALRLTSRASEPRHRSTTHRNE